MIDNHINPARAREIALVPDGKWSPELIKSLAQGYVDQAQVIVNLSAKIDEVESELAGMGNSFSAACDELAEVKAILRGLYP